MSLLTNEQRAELKRRFKVFDVDGDGQLTQQELKQVLCQMKIEMSDLEIANMIGQADADGSGTIDFDEYCAHKEAIGDERLKELFKRYDKNGDGFLEVEEIVEMAKGLGHGKISKRLAKTFIKSVDKDGDKRMNFEEFKILNSRGKAQ